MKLEVKTNSQTIKPASIKKPEGKPKVKLGTGKKLLYMSDTLFDDDLKA